MASAKLARKCSIAKGSAFRQASHWYSSSQQPLLIENINRAAPPECLKLRTKAQSR